MNELRRPQTPQEQKRKKRLKSMDLPPPSGGRFWSTANPPPAECSPQHGHPALVQDLFKRVAAGENLKGKRLVRLPPCPQCGQPLEIRPGLYNKEPAFYEVGPDGLIFVHAFNKDMINGITAIIRPP